MSEVVKEIARQLNAQGVPLKGRILVKMDSNTLRVAGRGRNIDVSYDRGNDLYNVKVHKIGRDKFNLKTGEVKIGKIQTCELKGLYFDQLPEVFNSKIVPRKCK